MDKLLGDAFAKYAQAQTEYTEALNEYADMKFRVESTRSIYLRDIDQAELGKNEAQRNANLDGKMLEMLDDAHSSKKTRNTKYGQLNIAEHRFDHLMMIARLKVGRDG